MFFIVCTILQIKNQGKEKYVSILLLTRTVFNYIIGLFFLISITTVYFGISGDIMDNCPKVRKVDLAYIICEWAIFSVCIIFHYAIVIFFVCCKAKRKYWNGEGEVDPEEMKKEEQESRWKKAPASGENPYTGQQGYPGVMPAGTSWTSQGQVQPSKAPLQQPQAPVQPSKAPSQQPQAPVQPTQEQSSVQTQSQPSPRRFNPDQKEDGVKVDMIDL